jgi:hypothetical protein
VVQSKVWWLMPDPRAFIREYMLNNRAQMSFNPAESGNNDAVDYLYFQVFDSATTYQGETWAAGDILVGLVTGDNLVYKSGLWRFRSASVNQVLIGQYGIRIAVGGLGFNQVTITTAAGANDLTESGEDFMRTSYVLIDSTAGAFSIDSIKVPTHQNQVLYIKNKIASNMTINDVAVAGAPPAGYWAIITQTGAAVATTGIGTAHLIANEVDNVWELITIQG